MDYSMLRTNMFVAAFLLIIMSRRLSEGFPEGAPSEACDSLSPSPLAHGAAPQNTTPPYLVDLSRLLDENGLYSYVPGLSYTMELQGLESQTFAGFLLQGRLLVDDVTPAGTFTSIEPLTQLSSCSPEDISLTHNSREGKTFIITQWTAPPVGAGPVRIGFAVVDNQAVYWADQRSDVIFERAPPEVAIMEPQQFTALRRTNLTLTCHFVAIPLPLVTWWHNEAALNFTDPDVSVVTTGNTSILTVQDVEPSDEGAYRCLVENSQGNNSVVSIVLVTDSCESEETLFEGVTLLWPVTAAGSIAVTPCPSSNATRQCTNEGVWLNPSTSTCSVLIESLSSITQLLVQENLDVQVNLFILELASSAEDSNQQTATVLQEVVTLYGRVADLVSSGRDTANNSIILPMVVTGLVKGLSSLQQWDPTILAASSGSSMILMSFEDIVGLFAQQVSTRIEINETEIILVVENIDLASLEQNGRSISFGDAGTTMSSTALSADFVLPPGVLASVSLPPSLFSGISDSTDSVGIFFALYNEAILFPLRGGVQAEVNSTLHPAVASPVVAATVGPGFDFNNLDPPVEINLLINTTSFEAVREGSETCVSWDFEAAGGQGNWTTEGCVRAAVRGDVVTCECNHLTNFAVLVDICSRVSDCANPPSEFEEAISIIGIIGAVLSLLGLCATALTFLWFKKLRARDIAKYHVQLCIAIFFMVLVFVAGVDRTAVYGGCVTVSVLIQYFSLVAVMWMGAEAVLMFQKLVLVFKRISTKEIIVTSVLCWTVPVVPVLIPLIVDMSNGSGPEDDLIVNRDQFCFLRNSAVFFGAFLGPIFAITLFNMVMFVVVITVLIRHVRNSLSRKKESLNPKTVLRLLTSVTGVMILFGLTWLFGALTITVQEVQLTFQFLFAIFTAFQGFFIFIFFCVLSKEVRDLWKECLCCGHQKSAQKFKTTSAANKYRRSSAPTNEDSLAKTSQTMLSDTTASFDTLNHSVSNHGSHEETKIDLVKN